MISGAPNICTSVYRSRAISDVVPGIYDDNVHCALSRKNRSSGRRHWCAKVEENDLTTKFVTLIVLVFVILTWFQHWLSLVVIITWFIVGII
uniref:Lysis protein n=1 Tax=Steinernema glaseri TaxID=37863 RepID=A0A1I7ZFE5_9BILA